MPIILSWSESNQINPPSPAIDFFNGPPGDENPMGDVFMHNYWGNQDFGWDVSFTMWDEDGNGNITSYVVTSVQYLSSYDFISANNTPANTIQIRRSANPFNEVFTLEQYEQGSLDREFGADAQQFSSEFTFDFDTNPIDIDKFNYYPPADQLFVQKSTEFDLPEIQANNDIQYIGISEWRHPDPKWLPLTHTFLVTGIDPQTQNVGVETISIYNEVHWNFDLSYNTFLQIESNSLNVDKDPVDGIPDDIEIVVPPEDANLTPQPL